MFAVRVKRKNSTIFLNVEKSDSFAVVKQKISDIMNVPSASIKLFTSTDADAILYMIFQKDGGAWEEIEVVDPKSTA